MAITDQSAPFAWPHAIPGGNVVFTDQRHGLLDDASVALLEVKTGKIETLVRGGTNPRYSPTGHLLYARGGSLYAAPFDPLQGRILGREQKLFEGVMTEENGAAQFSVAADGTLAYVAGGDDPRKHALVWVDREGRAELLTDGRQFRDVRLSPDGRRVLVTSPTGANFDIWLLDIERETLTRLTSHPGEDLHAAWSPDGTRLALASEIDEAAGGPGPALAWMRSLNATPELLVESPGWGNLEFPSS